MSQQYAMPRRSPVQAVWLALALAWGCADQQPPVGDVAGTVTIEGVPLAEGYVSFEDSSRGLGASATVKDGAYTFTTALDVGAYKVYVQPPSLAPTAVSSTGPPDGPIPRKYLFVGTSPLEATVNEGPNKFNFNLEK